MVHLNPIFLLLLSSIANDQLASPAHQIRFEPVTTARGVSASDVSHIYQDRLGFLWIATREGLAKYDGYRLRVFKHEPFDPYAPSSNDIRKIIEDHNGDIWTISGFAINRYDRDLDRFIRYEVQSPPSDGLGSRPLDLFCDSRGLIWVGTVDKGVYLYNHEFDNFINYGHNPVDSTSLSSDRVTSIFETAQGTMWFGTDGGGLNRFDFDTATFTHFLDEVEDPDFGISFGMASIPPNNETSPLFEDDAGTLWVITLGGGLIKLDPKTGEIISYTHDPDGTNSISSNLIYSMFPDSRGWLWLATDDGGLDVFNPQTEIFRKFRHDPRTSNSLSFSFRGPFSFSEDSWGHLWIGSTTGGIHVFDSQLDGFRHHKNEPMVAWSLPSNHVHTLLLDQSKTLWVGLQTGGLVKYSAHKMKFPGYFASPGQSDGLPMAAITTVFQDRQDRLWLGTQKEGLLHFDPQSGLVLRQFQTFSDHPGSPQIEDISAITQDREGNIWVGSRMGLFCIRPDSNNIRHYAIPERENQTVHALYLDQINRLWVGVDGGKLLQFEIGEKLFHSINLVAQPDKYWNAKIQVIIGGQKGGIWIAHTQVGLHYYEPDSGNLKSFTTSKTDICTISQRDISSLYLDYSGNLWVGTIGAGLLMLPQGGKCFQHFTQKKNNLPSNNIYAILQDRDHKIWVSFYSGLAVFMPRSTRFQVFDTGDGLVQPTSRPGAFFKNRLDQFFLGGREGLNVFNPHNLNHNPHPPPVVITGFSKMGETITHELTSGKALALSYRDNILVFEFAALDFTYPERNQYAFQLEGFHDKWVKPGTKREAIFTNLDDGDYVFRVKGSNSDGVWSTNPLTLKIRIAPPFWRTWWFYSLEALAGLLLVWSAFIYQRKRLKVQQNEALVALDLKRKTQELEYARHLQLSMLPKTNLDHAAFETFARMRTATEVGGDYYDFFELGPSQFAITVGDATGHGFAAGLVVGMTKMSTAVWAMNQQASPQELLEELNLGLKRSLSEKKMGMALGLVTLDLEHNRANLAFSGMPYPYHYRATTDKLCPLVMKGPPLGYFERIFVQTQQVQLAPDDYLIFLSDGFLERFNLENKLWGQSRLETCLQQICATRADAEGVTDATFQACDDFADGRNHDDDMTMVVLRMKPQASATQPQHYTRPD